MRGPIDVIRFVFRELPLSLQFIEGHWCILFSHPKDYTPVCTTELGEAAKLQGEFDARGVKMIALSCDSVEDHLGWKKDINAARSVEVRSARGSGGGGARVAFAPRRARAAAAAALAA